MNNIKIFSFLTVISLPMIMQAQGIKFEEGLSWNQVRTMAIKENKYIFLDCFATWCGPCKWMDQKVYPNDTIGSYFNKRFVSIKVQMDTNQADSKFIKQWYGDANRIKNKYKVDAFPTYLFFSPNGKIVHRDLGVKPYVREFISVGLDALDGDKQYYTALNKYRRNELDTAYMKALAQKVKLFGEEKLARKIANDYITRSPFHALCTQENLWFMIEFTKSSKERGFKLFRDSANRLSNIDGKVREGNCKAIVLNIINNESIKPYLTAKKGKVDLAKIKSSLKKYGSLGQEAFTFYKPVIIFKTEIEPALKLNSDWYQILPLIEKQNLGASAEFVVGSTIIYYLNGIAAYHTEKNCKNLIAAATYYAGFFPTLLTSGALNDWAWTIFEHSSDIDDLNKALAWSKQSIELQSKSSEPELLDTYANLLYKLGRNDEAIVWEGEAIQAENIRSKKMSTTPQPEYLQTLEKMKKGEKTWLEK